MSETSVGGTSSTPVSSTGFEFKGAPSTRSSTVPFWSFDSVSLGRSGGVSGVGVLMVTREAEVC